MGDGSANYTFLMDDIDLVYVEPTLDPPTLPLDFESAEVDYSFSDFDGGAMTVIDNPQASGINTSSKVAQMVKNAGQTWGGSSIILEDPLDFSVNKTFKMKVYSPRADAKVLLKVENPEDGGIFFEKEVDITVANEWEELTFDYSEISTADTYQKLVFIFDNGSMGDGTENYTFLMDDIMLVSEATSVDNVSESIASIYAYNNHIIVNCGEDMLNGKLEVFDLTGRKVVQSRIEENTTELAISQKGILIVRISNAKNQSIARRIVLK
jgi:hypothetical protein